MSPIVSGKFELNVQLVKNEARMSISNIPFTSVVKSNVISIQNIIVVGEVISWSEGKIKKDSPPSGLNQPYQRFYLRNQVHDEGGTARGRRR